MIAGGHQYQWLTSYDRQRLDGHRLDWPGQPSFFKNYPSCSSYLLPLPDSLPQCRLFALLKKKSLPGGTRSESLNRIVWNRHSLATLLLLTSAPTARSTFAEGEIWYRSNASAGALHPLEFYLSFPGSMDLPAGIYHYDLLKPGLNRLRHDPALAAFISACGADSQEEGSAPTLLISGIFFRSAWKYRTRAYRYLLNDAGHALENLSLALTAMGIDFAVHLDFDDALITQALGFDAQREVGLVAVRLRAEPLSAENCILLAKDDPEPELTASSRVSAREIDYPLLNEMHQVSSVARLQERTVHGVIPEFWAEISDWQELPEVLPPELALDYIESLRRRRSQRNFIEKRELQVETLHLLLGIMVQGVGDLDLPGLAIAFVASGVCGLADGLYLFDRATGRFALLFARDLRSEVAAAALDQRWLKQASLQFLFYADLEAAQEKFSPRSYRHLQIGAGRLGQRLYLGATSLSLGGCAVGAFYDRELARIYRLPENFDPLYLVAVGPLAAPK